MTAKVLAALALSGENDLNDILSAKQITLFLSPLARMCVSASLALALAVSLSSLFPFPRLSPSLSLSVFLSLGELSSPIMRIINLTGSQARPLSTPFSSLSSPSSSLSVSLLLLHVCLLPSEHLSRFTSCQNLSFNRQWALFALIVVIMRSPECSRAPRRSSPPPLRLCLHY